MPQARAGKSLARNLIFIYPIFRLGELKRCRAFPRCEPLGFRSHPEVPRSPAMKLVLVHPPLDDPTIPYHSTASLAGPLVHCGFTDVAIRDVNIELVNWTFEP